MLGKGQEVTRLLTDAGIPVLQHREHLRRQPGVRGVRRAAWAATSVSPAQAEPGWAVVVPPGGGRLPELGRQVRIAVTGWAIDPRTKYRLGVDHAVPLSDHADYDELFEAVARVEPRVVYCTHGPESFRRSAARRRPRRPSAGPPPPDAAVLTAFLSTKH